MLGGVCIMGMTENKRFGMIKTQFNGLHVPIDEWNHFIFSSCESELDCMRIVNALNSLHEKAMSNGRIASELLNAKEQLEKENKGLQEKMGFAGLLANHRGEMVSFANALIQDLDDEKTQEMWENFKDEMYKEWKQKRGIE